MLPCVATVANVGFDPVQDQGKMGSGGSDGRYNGGRFNGSKATV